MEDFQSCKSPRAGHSRQRKQLILRPQGRSMPSMLRKSRVAGAGDEVREVMGARSCRPLASVSTLVSILSDMGNHGRVLNKRVTALI